MSKISIFSHTQASFVDAVVQRLNKGRLHAAGLYSQWFRQGHCDVLTTWVEPQALALMQQMIDQVDFSLPTLAHIVQEEETIKFLLQFAGGVLSETVLIPMLAGRTLCLSSQIGCQRGCAFCETGKRGLIRNLMCAEIIAQVFYARFVLKQQVRNIVFMGMGEPLDNYDAVMQAIDILTQKGGLGFGPSRITVSTSGHVEGMYRMLQEASTALNLAVSINAPYDELRNRLMPINRKWNLSVLKQAMLDYCVHPRRTILIGYVLLGNVNDSLEEADALAVYLEGLRVKVNLIPYNPQKRDRFIAPTKERQEAFAKRLKMHGYQTLLRGTKGQKIMAACGQLGSIPNEFQKNILLGNLRDV